MSSSHETDWAYSITKVPGTHTGLLYTQDEYFDYIHCVPKNM